MTVRTTRTTISFSQQFKLRDVDDIQPAGDYFLDTDEVLIEGLRRNTSAFAIHVSSARPHRGALGQPCGTRCGAGKRSN